jgi:hypothetical protein
MSDFVSRMAARLVGDAVIAQPRLRGLFEADGPASAIEIIEEEAVAESGRHAAESVLPTPALSAPPALPTEPTPAESAPLAPSSAVAYAGHPSAEAQPEDARPAAVATAVPRSELSPEPPPAQANPAPGPPGLAVIAVPASPVLPANAQAPEPPAPAYEAAEQEQLQPVRVHIGRLEVRATLEDQPRRAPEREERPPAGLSLAGYLRGERETAS